MISYETVIEFEQKLAKFFGSKFAVCTDCCTHAVELCLRYTNANDVVCPARTYLSIPMTLIKLNLKWRWKDYPWQDWYKLDNTNIIDGANHWTQDGYIKNTFMCISFQFKKPLSLGRGGAILCDSHEDYMALKKMTHDGRDPTSNKQWKEHNIESIGYHYYMTPETAEQGISKMYKTIKEKTWTDQDYPYLPDYKVFAK